MKPTYKIKTILTENMQRLHDVAQALLDKERLEGYEFDPDIQ